MLCSRRHCHLSQATLQLVMERMKVLIADDDAEHLEQVFEIVNSKDPLIQKNKVTTGEGRLVEEALPDRSAQEFPLRLKGSIEILCAGSYNEAIQLIEEHGDVDICLSDIQFSGESADGPSILNVCGVSPDTGILYTAQPEKQEIYKGISTYVENENEYKRADKNQFIVVRYNKNTKDKNPTEDFENIIYRFLLDSERLLAKSRIRDTSLSGGTETAWKNFEEKLDNLLSRDRPNRKDFQNCKTALTLKGGLEETNFGGIQFKHLFPFHNAFLNRRLKEVSKIIDNGPDEERPSWGHVKNKINKLKHGIKTTLYERDEYQTGKNPTENEMHDDYSTSTGKIEPRGIDINLNREPDEDKPVVRVTTNKDFSYESTGIRNSGLFFLLSVVISDFESFPIDECIDTSYEEKEYVSMFLASLLVNKFMKPSRKPGYLTYWRKKGPPFGNEGIVSRTSIDSSYLRRCILEKEMYTKKIKSEINYDYRCKIGSLPQSSSGHKLHLMKDLGIEDESFKIFKSKDQKWRLSRGINLVSINPPGIEMDTGSQSEEEWAQKISKQLTS